MRHVAHSVGRVGWLLRQTAAINKLARLIRRFASVKLLIGYWNKKSETQAGRDKDQ